MKFNELQLEHGTGGKYFGADSSMVWNLEEKLHTAFRANIVAEAKKIAQVIIDTGYAEAIQDVIEPYRNIKRYMSYAKYLINDDVNDAIKAVEKMIGYYPEVKQD